MQTKCVLIGRLLIVIECKVDKWQVWYLRDCQTVEIYILFKTPIHLLKITKELNVNIANSDNRH